MARHGGLNLSNVCFMDMFPDQQTAIILQTNYMSDERALNILFELFDELLKPEILLRPSPPKPIVARVSDVMLGEYFNPTEGIVTLSHNDGQLLLNQEYPLICIGDGQYYYSIGELRFPATFLDDGLLSVRSIPYRHIQSVNFEPDFDQWKQYTGVFIDPFTPYPDVSEIRVHFETDQLLINDFPKRALSNTQFISSHGFYEFIGTDILQVKMGTRFVRKVNQKDP